MRVEIVIHLGRCPMVGRDVEAGDDTEAVFGVPAVVHAASEVGQAAAGFAVRPAD